MRAECCSEAAFGRSWLCAELLFPRSELEGAGERYIFHRMKLPNPATFQQVVLLLSQLFSFCAVSIRRTEAGTGLSYGNVSYLPRGNIIYGVKFMPIMK